MAGLFFLAGADFLGAVQLMVYVGGTMVLLVFGVMLTARGPFVSMKTGGGQWILAIVVGGALLAVLIQAAWSIPGWAEPSRDVDDAEALARSADRSLSPGWNHTLDICLWPSAGGSSWCGLRNHDLAHPRNDRRRCGT